jgi:hypothetical protein
LFLYSMSPEPARGDLEVYCYAGCRLYAFKKAAKLK